MRLKLSLLILLTLTFVIASCSSSQDFFSQISNYETRSDGAVRVTNCSGINSCQNPVFSPDGKEIIFTRFMKGYNQGPSEIVKLNIETGREEIIVKNESDNVNVPYGSWIGNKIIFSSDLEGIEEIYSANDNGGKVKRLTNHYEFEGSYIEPVYNPADTKLIVFEYARENGEHSIQLLDLSTGGGFSDLTNPLEYDDRLPSFSPDGKSISWQRTKVGEDNWRIFVADLVLQPKPRLTNTRAVSPGPDNTDNSWMWNGKYILSSTTGDGEVPNIFAFPVEEGAKTEKEKPIRVSKSREKEDGAPTNSPDGKLVAFESHILDDENSPSEIWIIRTPQVLLNQSFSSDAFENGEKEKKLIETGIDEDDGVDEELSESEEDIEDLSFDEDLEGVDEELVDEELSESESADEQFDLSDLPDRNIEMWKPKQGLSFQWQFADSLNSAVDADVYMIDGFDTSKEIVNSLHSKGRKASCYVNVGAWEDWRTDKDEFPKEVLGNDYSGWEGEKWLDIRKIDKIGSIMQKRFDVCKEKGFDAIEPDNIDGYLQDTGFEINYEDQLKYNKWIAEQAHARGLSIGLKNDGDQVKDLVDYYDFAIMEGCFNDNFCEQFLPFSEKQKAVAMIEYTDTNVDFKKACEKAKELGFSAVLKNRNLDEFRKVC